MLTTKWQLYVEFGIAFSLPIRAEPKVDTKLFYAQRCAQEGRLLRGGERSVALVSHQATGDRMMAAVLGVIALAFSAQLARAQFDGVEATAYLVPGHFHGWAGLLALAMMLNLWRLGRKTRDLKAEGQSFARSKKMHGRISDVMMMLVFIHAFLGFLYLLQIL